MQESQKWLIPVDAALKWIFKCGVKWSFYRAQRVNFRHSVTLKKPSDLGFFLFYLVKLKEETIEISMKFVLVHPTNTELIFQYFYIYSVVGVSVLDNLFAMR